VVLGSVVRWVGKLWWWLLLSEVGENAVSSLRFRSLSWLAAAEVSEICHVTMSQYSLTIQQPKYLP